MNLLTKSPASPEMIDALKADGQTVMEVTVKRYYILHTEPAMAPLMHEWFVLYRGRSHAYRDGSLVGGADEVQQIKNLTTGKAVNINEKPPTDSSNTEPQTGPTTTAECAAS